MKSKRQTPIPSGGGSSPSPVKHRGRPKGSKNREKENEKEKGLLTTLNPKAHRILQKIVADTEQVNKLPALTPAEFDGGGTHESAQTITKESLERRTSRRLNVLDRYLTDEMLHQLLSQSSLKEIGIYEGIMMDKMLVLKGQPTVIIGNAERAEIENVLPRLLRELNRRGLTATATERKVEFRGTHDPDTDGRS